MRGKRRRHSRVRWARLARRRVCAAVPAAAAVHRPSICPRETFCCEFVRQQAHLRVTNPIRSHKIRKKRCCVCADLGWSERERLSVGAALRAGRGGVGEAPIAAPSSGTPAAPSAGLRSREPELDCLSCEPPMDLSHPICIKDQGESTAGGALTSAATRGFFGSENFFSMDFFGLAAAAPRLIWPTRLW